MITEYLTGNCDQEILIQAIFPSVGLLQLQRWALEKYLACYRKFNVICNCLTLINIKGSHLRAIKNACSVVVVDHV